MTYCYGGMGRSVGVMFDSFYDMQNFTRELQRLVDAGSVPCAKYDRMGEEFTFDTGSVLRALCASAPFVLEGRKFTKVLYDEKITSESLLSKLQAMEFENSGTMFKVNDDIVADTSKIDEFLSEFR